MDRSEASRTTPAAELASEGGFQSAAQPDLARDSQSGEAFYDAADGMPQHRPSADLCYGMG